MLILRESVSPPEIQEEFGAVSGLPVCEVEVPWVIPSTCAIFTLFSTFHGNKVNQTVSAEYLADGGTAKRCLYLARSLMLKA